MSKRQQKNNPQQTLPGSCPCGTARLYAECCAPLHAGADIAHSAEQLMRSRYCAYVLGLSDYVLASWHESTRPAQLDLHEMPRTLWQSLTVISASAVETDTQVQTTTAYVEFIARYKNNGRSLRLHERSRFVCEQGRWFYVEGVFLND